MRRCPASGPRQPYTRAEIDGYLALARAQPTPGRRSRAAALVCLGAGAGLIRSDLRNVRGTDICCRSGGVIVQVRGGGRRGRCRCWPATTPRLLAQPRSPGENFLTGGTSPSGATSPTR